MQAWRAINKDPEILGEDPVKATIDGLIEADIIAVPDGFTTVPMRTLFRHSFDKDHGNRTSSKERQTIACAVYEENTELKQRDVARLLGVQASHVSTWVSHILARRREERQSKATRLSLLGWAQEEVAGRLGVSQDTISKDLQKTSEWKISVKSLLAAGHPVDVVGKRLNLPATLIWATSL